MTRLPPPTRLPSRFATPRRSPAGGRRTPDGKTEGLTLLEVLLTLVIVAIGLLGMAKLQLIGLQNAHETLMRSQAINLAYDIMDRMRANEGGITNGYYNNIPTIVPGYPLPGACTAVAPNCSTGSCSSQQMATYDAFSWYCNVATLLPGGSATVTGTGSGNPFRVVINWVEPGVSLTTVGTPAGGFVEMPTNATDCRDASSNIDTTCYRVDFRPL